MAGEENRGMGRACGRARLVRSRICGIIGFSGFSQRSSVFGLAGFSVAAKRNTVNHDNPVNPDSGKGGGAGWVFWERGRLARNALARVTLTLALSHEGLTGVGFGFRGGKPPSRRRAEAATVQAAAARGDASPHPALGQKAAQRRHADAKYAHESVSLRRGFRRRAQRARTPFQRIGVLHPAAEGERQA